MRRAFVIGFLLTAWIGFAAPAQAAETVWLCKPGQSPNPCAGDLSATIFTGAATRTETYPRSRSARKVDCFYVYPTVSEQLSESSDRSIDPQQTAIAEYQAQRFSQHCRIFAPVYRQRTLLAISNPLANQAAATRLAYSDVLDAWRTYLREDNGGRPFVLIGHSQGTRMLRQLVRTEIDRRRALRKRLISAILLGGNVTVARGEDAGGDFRRIPACRSRRQTGCVIAFSAFFDPPPSNSRFGRVPAGPDRNDPFGLPTGSKFEVLCTNPAALAGGASPVETFLREEQFPGVLGAGILITVGGFAPQVPTPWFVPADRYSGKCERINGAHVLKLSPLSGARRLNPFPDPTWGVHLADGNIALGDLVRIVGRQSRVYLRR